MPHVTWQVRPQPVTKMKQAENILSVYSEWTELKNKPANTGSTDPIPWQPEVVKKLIFYESLTRS
jgi:hypothetical protein